MVYPNPVYEDYNGEIVISGLKNDTNVKINDIAGNIVYETYSNGGTATWNGKNFDGKKLKQEYACSSVLMKLTKVE